MPPAACHSFANLGAVGPKSLCVHSFHSVHSFHCVPSCTFLPFFVSKYGVHEGCKRELYCFRVGCDCKENKFRTKKASFLVLACSHMQRSCSAISCKAVSFKSKFVNGGVLFLFNFLCLTSPLTLFSVSLSSRGADMGTQAAISVCILPVTEE